MLNPLRSEDEAFRFLLYVGAVVVVIVVVVLVARASSGAWNSDVMASANRGQADARHRGPGAQAASSAAT